MKVYRSKGDKPKIKLNKKAIISIAVSVALVVTALAVTLSLTLGRGQTQPPDDGGGQPVITTPVYVLPVDSYEIGKDFDKTKLVRHVTAGMIQTHEAVDFLVPLGTEVSAVFDGMVISVDVGTSMEGGVVRIQHAGGVVSVYKGLADDIYVEAGDTVKAGDVIGTVGIMPIEARDYEQSHLHLEMRLNGVTVNPLNYLPELGDK
ncbi:MAG: M23 family metallopeptidase [Firmicutes bacterium]|nr:M23 family metallopeptidase [Bacillota bacterium]